MTRKFRAAWEDLRDYWLVRAGRFAVTALFWSLVVAVAVALLPFSKGTREKLAKKVGFYAGRLFWEFRRVSFLREWLPPLRNLVRSEVRDPQGNLKWADYGFNVRTNEGRDWQCDRMGASGTTYPARYISVHSASAYTPAATDTIATWETNEELANGFGRELGDYAHTGGQANYTLDFTYTATGTVVIYGAALINEEAAASEILFTTKNFATEATMQNLDTLAVTWDITV